MKLSKDQARAIAAYIIACRRYQSSPNLNPILRCQRDDAWALCKAMGIIFLANGGIAIDPVYKD